MSLTSELRGGPLADWFAARFPGRGLAADLATDLMGRPRSGPSNGDLDPGHWPAVGGAVGTRLGWAVEPAPPYYALYGSHNAGLIGWDDAHQAAAAFSTHRPGEHGPPLGSEGRALAWRPTPTGWVDTAPSAGEQPARRQDGTHPEIVGGFAARAAAFLDRVPPGAFGTDGEETVLARVALVLGDWEQAYRRGPDVPRAARAALERAAVAGDAGALLESVDPAALADTTALIAHARRHGLLDQLAGTAAAATLRGHAFPVFAEQWADGDLLLDPGDGNSTTLIDIKTVMSGRNPSTVLRWLWQLLGYAYLADLGCPEWRIGRVGLCFARHAHVVAWDVDEPGLLAARSAPGAFAHERAGFRAVFTATMTARGLQLS